MAKRKSFKREMSERLAKNTREWKRKMTTEVCEKNKVETVGDVLGVFYGLSRKAVEKAAFAMIQELAARGCTPAEIINRMEGKHEGTRRSER